MSSHIDTDVGGGTAVDHDDTDSPFSTPTDRTVPTARRSVFETTGERAQQLLRHVWNDGRIGGATAVVVAVGWALVAGFWTPRGPLTTSQAVCSIAISLVVGALAGVMMRSRWAVLVAPAVFAAFFEFVRSGTEGPTVDAPHFSTYGILALVVGRGFHGAISLAPMAYGAVFGAGAARQVARRSEPVEPARRWPQLIRRGVAVVAALGLAMFTVLLARPASTDAIVDADGERVPGSIAEVSTIDVNGHDLHVMIRGYDIDNPVLLFLAGGPGGSEMGAMRKHLRELEEHFTVVTWDQRGTGKSYDELDPTSTYTLDGVVDDTIVVSNHLRDRFDQDRIYLVGQSWGSTLGVLAVQRQPDLYEAFVGVGQMVSQLATDTIFYNDTLDWARANGDDGLAADLTAIGPPPYERMLDYETALSSEHEVYPYDHSANAEGEGGFSENFLVPEYTLIDQVHLLGAFVDTFSVLYPQLQDIDFRRTATDFETPMFFVQGAHEADGRADVFADWYPMVDAPIKDLAVLGTSGHRPLWEQPDEFVDYMVGTVLDRTAAAD
jgi:pimeloyl-ACP methyl ester carboxylesterase